MSTVKDNIIYGGVVSSDITSSYGSFSQFALDRFKTIGEKKILIDAMSGIEYSGKQLHDEILKLAIALQNIGVKEGSVIGLCSENRIEFVLTAFATFCLNAALAPFNITYTEREADYVVNLSHPMVLFTSERQLEKLKNIAAKNKFIKYIFVFDNVNVSGNVKTFSQLINNISMKKILKFKFKPTNINNNVALIMCSSGTTGLPKGVQLTQRNIISVINQQLINNEILEQSSVLSVLPWFHAFGCLTMIIMSCVGTRFVFLPKFEEQLFLSTIQNYKINLAMVVPPLMIFLAKHPTVDKYDLSTLIGLLCGAAPLSKDTEDAVKERIGVSFIRQGYGLSESTLSLLVQTDEFCKPGSVGIVKPGLYGKVIDTETGKPLGPYEKGELCFKGDCIMKGYIGDKKSTDDVIDKDGWLHTGDIGYYDKDLEFFIVDRIKELIKYKAYQVPPAELESLLLKHPKIKDTAVVGLPNEECGELPFAFIVKQPNVNLSEEEIIKFVAENASPAKRLRGGVQFINEIPKNASGKILRRKLRDILKEMPKSKL